MERFTISLDHELADEFDRLIARRGYANRSEAVRDLIRRELEADRLAQAQAPWCVATVSYVYNHHERSLAGRLAHLQHEHHDVAVATMHAHLDHEHCLETMMLKGPTAAVRACADALVAERGVRHGHVHLVPIEVEHGPHPHGHDHHGGPGHQHARPTT
ncbi:nickel-responsive transcriptional regulator NikR [Caldimonas thermodepolymerans]|jgi:CopG family nickel-responsive transcriptional regulator|uniref:Putative nickel-responsive regulator n=1 Tax=Caldimonas thermodepolymerans TaxID=215580 RepID=A0A2S5T532_9BURK|nr:nickel-responsive transcriptional regulator NikR [Caldimonas thermodepolymerans]PPE70091.1 nickel-responsive transcriptional regulator NikR [Caldimonas thermodepolymerans]QPC31838.1 nickel-responsive transcriptional regulator NikR [Caldimonas thermodepolymerans]RDI01656.1 CopG family transcriptional regulator [Caldimonas thermodepolymerans]TCP05793.1 CopG family transcriptional regulator [Caldimonas thermodepolymerans]UZG48266.1 nickel-responsive transcriptional regulator NikR [Caldimonas t